MSQNTTIIGEQVAECLYGENAWQQPAALYSTGTNDPLALDRFMLVAGTSPSYNNLVDVERALQTMTHIVAGFELNRGIVPNIAVAVKHGNACGVGVTGRGGVNEVHALEKMIRGDVRAILGGVVMTNFPITTALTWVLSTYQTDVQQRLLDCIVAPSFTADAVAALKRRRGKCRFLVNPELASLTRQSTVCFLRNPSLKCL